MVAFFSNNLEIDTRLSNMESETQTYLAKSAGLMTGTVDMGSNKITSTYVPVNPADLINKTYSDTKYATNPTYNLGVSTLNNALIISPMTSDYT